MMRLLLAAFLIVMAGCSVSERPSTILQRAEAAGSGKLASASVQGMQSWLERHRDLAADLDRMCAPVRQKADAQWLDTTEGRLCTASRNVAMSTFKRLEGDHKTYGAGWK
jgi:uncharacterized lipoprotein YmbA